jgi:hypothetical protein
MEGVEGLPWTAWRLLDAGELHCVAEHVFAIPLLHPPFHEIASLCGVALESLIHNIVDCAVVFLLLLTPRVEICGRGMLRAKGDERAVFVSAQNNSNGMLEKNDGNLRKHVTAASE